jgi:hypothetical protein
MSQSLEMIFQKKKTRQMEVGWIILTSFIYFTIYIRVKSFNYRHISFILKNGKSMISLLFYK